MMEIDQKMRIDDYRAKIYPIWAPINALWEKSWETGKSEPEISVVHRIDWAIFESGYRIDRDFATPEDSRTARIKEAGRALYRGVED